MRGIETDGGRVTGVRTSLGDIGCNRLGIMAGGYSTVVAAMLGIELPIHPLTIQAMVTHPLKPFLHHVFSSTGYHVYANQTLKGEIATGAHMDPQVNYTTDATAYYLKHQAEALVELMPALRGVRFMRIWAGLADMTPDMAPIMEGNLGWDGLYFDAGWGYFGFKSGPVAGKYMAEYMATGERPGDSEGVSAETFSGESVFGGDGGGHEVRALGLMGRVCGGVRAAGAGAVFGRWAAGAGCAGDQLAGAGVMTFRLTCPVCGKRDVYEFTFGGQERGPRPAQEGLSAEEHFRWVQFRLIPGGGG